MKVTARCLDSGLALVVEPFIFIIIKISLFFWETPVPIEVKSVLLFQALHLEKASSDLLREGLVLIIKRADYDLRSPLFDNIVADN